MAQQVDPSKLTKIINETDIKFVLANKGGSRSITNCFFIGLANKKNAIFAKDLINDCKGGVTEPAMPPSRGGLDGVARHFVWG